MRYQKVYTQIWNDEKFEALSERGQRLFLYLLTCPHSNLIGCYVLKPGYATDDLGWSKEVLSKVLNEVLDKGLISYDEKHHVVLLKNYLKHNQITNPNQVKAGIKYIKALPKSFILQELKEHIEGLPEGLYKGLLEVLGEVLLYSSSSSSKKDLKDLKAEKPKKEEGNGKFQYAEYVQMRKEDYDRLVEDFGIKVVRRKIGELNEYIGARGAHQKYKRHDLVLRSWLRKEGIDPHGSVAEPEKNEEELLARKEAAEMEAAWSVMVREMTNTDLDKLKSRALMLLKDEFPPGLILQPMIKAKMIELYRQRSTGAPV